jgi:hypothetical protein
VIASDGFNNGEDTSDADFTVADNAPAVQINAPAQGSLVPPGAALQLSGDATDLEDGELPEESFVWMEGQDVLGTGREALANLAPGPHTLTLTVSDQAGNISTAAVDLFVGLRIYLPMISQ